MDILDFIRDHSKYIALAVGIAVGFPLMAVRRERLKISVGVAFLLSVSFTVLSLAATMLLAMIEALLSGETPSIGAVSVMGVYLFAAPAVFIATKLFRWKIEDAFDLYAIYALPSLFLMRINCLIAGCCLGRNIGSTGLRWPTREVELGVYTVLFFLLLLREKDKTQRGTLFPFLMTVYGVFRFIIEWFRVGNGPSLLHWSHLWAVLIGIAGYVWYTELRSKTGKQRH